MLFYKSITEKMIARRREDESGLGCSLGEQALDFRAYAPLLPGLAGGDGPVLCVVLHGLVDGSRHLDLHLLVGPVRGQPLALDRDHLLSLLTLVFVQRLSVLLWCFGRD